MLPFWMEAPQDPESSVERAEELREVEKDEAEGGDDAVEIKDDGEKRLKKAQEKQEVVRRRWLELCCGRSPSSSTTAFRQGDPTAPELVSSPPRKLGSQQRTG